MKKVILLLMVLVVSAASGCRTIKSGSHLVDDAARHGKSGLVDTAISNGNYAVSMVRMLNLEAGISELGDRESCIEYLQLLKYWPQGEFVANQSLTEKTFKEVNALLMASKKIAPVGRNTIEKNTQITIKVYTTNAEDAKVYETEVDESGCVKLPMINEIMIAGMSPSRAAKVIRNAYIDSKYYKDLTVDVVGAKGSITIGGDGMITSASLEYETGMTLSQAIFKAGGTKEFAKKTAVSIRRGGRVLIYDLEDIQDGNKPDPKLEPNDIILVRERIM